jgi:helicase
MIANHFLHGSIELHRGVLCDGKFYFRRYNDCREGLEYFTGDDSPPDGSNIPTELFRGLKHLLAKNEQVLIFTATRGSCFRLAAELASILTLPPAVDVLHQLEDIPDTLQKADLQICLKHGIGFHNADLSLSLRRILESGFRDGSIRILVSTSTLGMGVNFPTKNVFIEAFKCYDGQNGQSALKPLVMYDYNQIAGRAGRLGHTDDFGRAIFIASDDTRREVLWESYIYGCARPDIEPFDTERLAELLLRWVCCGLARDHNDASALYAMTLRAHQKHFKEAVPRGALELLNKHGFLELKGCRFGCTPLGLAVAAHNIVLSTALLIKSGFNNLGISDKFLSWLYYLLDTPDGRKIILHRKTMPFFHYNIYEIIDRLLEQYNETPVGPLKELVDKPDTLPERSRLETFFLLAQITRSVPTIELEARFNIGWGRIKHLGETMANLFLAAGQIGHDCGLNSEQIVHLQLQAEQLYWGLPESGLPLARLKAPLLERDFILMLNNGGLYTASDIIDAGVDVVASIIPQRVAQSLYKTAQGNLAGRQKSDEMNFKVKRPPLIAKKSGERFEVLINGIMVSLQPRQYSYLCKLYNCDHQDGWLDKNYLDCGDNQVKYFHTLKKALAHVSGLTLESDGAGKYRLLLAQEINGSGHIGNKQAGAFYGWG